MNVPGFNPRQTDSSDHITSHADAPAGRPESQERRPEDLGCQILNAKDIYVKSCTYFTFTFCAFQSYLYIKIKLFIY